MVGSSGGSGGYADYVFRMVARDVRGSVPGELTYSVKRNKDYQHIALEVRNQLRKTNVRE